jgi:hypothetical protein
MRKLKKKAPAKKTVKKKHKRINWKAAAIELANCVIFAIKFDKHMGRGNGEVINLKTMKPMGPWQEKFFDALDSIGYVIDRKAYYASKEHKRRA